MKDIIAPKNGAGQNLFSAAICNAIRGYQKFVSPFLGSQCRFSPSCSEYAREAIERFGIFQGTLKFFLRLLHCHPFHPGGHDPVVQNEF